jgi:hypothetical protein
MLGHGMPCPDRLNENNHPMHVIGHYDEFIKHRVQKMLRDPFPAFFYNPSDP